MQKRQGDLQESHSNRFLERTTTRELQQPKWALAMGPVRYCSLKEKGYFPRSRGFVKFCSPSCHRTEFWQCGQNYTHLMCWAYCAPQVVQAAHTYF